MVKKMVFSDLDGTLLDKIGHLSENYRIELNDLIEKGLNFSIATGRNYKSAKEALGEVNIKYPVILADGAILANWKSGRILRMLNIHPKIIIELTRLCSRYNIFPSVVGYYEKSINCVVIERNVKTDDSIIVGQSMNESEFLKISKKPIVNLFFHSILPGFDDLYDELNKRLKSHFHFNYIQSFSKNKEINGFWVELLSPFAGKGAMLAYFCEQYLIEPENVVVFGDYYNDVEMFKYAGKAIAVSNGVPEAIKAADEICQPNNNGGVIQYLKNHFEDLI